MKTCRSLLCMCCVLRLRPQDKTTTVLCTGQDRTQETGDTEFIQTPRRHATLAQRALPISLGHKYSESTLLHSCDCFSFCHCAVLLPSFVRVCMTRHTADSKPNPTTTTPASGVPRDKNTTRNVIIRIKHGMTYVVVVFLGGQSWKLLLLRW